MTNGISGGTKLSPIVIIVVIVIVVVIVGIVGSKTVLQGGQSEKVSVDSNKVKELIKSGGFGHK